jgi:uncharacterized lipoprotein YddW (UPF0748 family)
LSLRSAIIFALCLVRLPSLAQQPAAPKREVRAVWITTAASLDWPRSTDKTEQQQLLKKIVWDLKAANFNTIFFQVRARGNAYYASSYEPWAENLTGTLGQDPGWDPLAFLLREARGAGLEVHAWFNVYKVRGPTPVGPSSPQHPSRAHPQWMIVYDEEGWLDPGIPEVRSYLLRVALDVVRKYDIDGMHFDFIRYPGRDFPDAETFRRFGNGMDRENWRRNNIDRFVAEFYDSATALKPMLKVGSAPLGLYDGMKTGTNTGSYYSYFQDSQGWLRKQKHDYLAPQLYWPLNSTNGSPNFVALVRDWQRRSTGRHIYAGIAAYKPEIGRELAAYIDIARAAGIDGQAYFRYESIQQLNMFGNRYRTLANIPPMPWKDSIPPLPPSNLAVIELAPDVFHLEWTTPRKAEDGDEARYYNIYRSTKRELDVNDPFNLVAITTSNANYFVDTVKVPGGLRYYYAVAALDKGNNESPPSNVSGVSIREVQTFSNRLSNFNSLSTSLPNGTAGPTLVAYKLAQHGTVSLDIVEKGAGGTERIALVLTKGTEKAGTHVVGVPQGQLGAGSYIIRLRAGDLLLEQPLQITR